VGNKSDTSLELDLDGADAIMVIEGFPGTTSQKAAAQKELSRLSGAVRNVVQDNSAADQILEPSVGYRRGVGGVFDGTLDTPQGPGTQVVAAIMAATDGKATVAVIVLSDGPSRRFAFAAADAVLNTFRFPTEIQS